MTLTKRQWIMFTLFVIELSYVLFTAAIVGSLIVISSSLSTILFLGALYLEYNHNSKRMLLLAAVWMIVNMLFSAVQIVPMLLTNFSLFAMIDFIIVILLYVGIYLFAMKYYKGGFYNKKENLIITVLVIPTILLGFYMLFDFLRLPIGGNPIEITYVIVGFISSMIVPLAIIIYTWLKHKNIE